MAKSFFESICCASVSAATSLNTPLYAPELIQIKSLLLQISTSFAVFPAVCIFTFFTTELNGVAVRL
jgi:hypothetical protein